MSYLPEDKTPSWSGAVPLTAGILALIVLIGGLGLWSVKARLAGAIVTQGVVQVDQNRQVVQHPEGGVVGAIEVSNGTRVEKGDVLIRLDGRRVQSELAIVDGQLREIAARQARMQAERDGANEIVFDGAVLEQAASDAAVRQLIEGERALFNARREALEQEASLLQEQNLQIANRVIGVKSQIEAITVKIALLGEDLEGQQKLLEQKLTQSSRVSELMRERVDAQGQAGRLEAEVAELRGQAASNEISLLQLKTRRREEAVTMLRDLQYRRIELTQRQIALTDTLSRLDIRAPVGGLVYDMKVFAVQSVVRPAEPLLYIIPQDRPLVVSTRVQAMNVDEVHVGQEVALRFSSFNQKTAPEIHGQVTRLSADVIQDEKTGQSFYAAEIMPYAIEMEKLGDQTVLPGMPVQAYFRTRDHTPLDYLGEPLRVFFDKAMRE